MVATRWRPTFRVGDRHVIGLSDGAFTMTEGFMNRPGFQEQLADERGVAELPVACFLVPGEPTVLLDAGLGPFFFDNLRGGLLLEELGTVGVRPADVDVIAVSHLHLDHDGWLATPGGEAVFPNATIHVGRADYDHFVTHGDDVPRRLRMAPYLRQALAERLDAGRLVLLDDATEVAPGVVALPAPGHTPGHMVFAVADAGERLLVLGDAMYCAAQLTDLDLAAAHDVDPALARRTRESIAREMDAHGTSGVGCHFPGLHAARVLAGEAVTVTEAPA